MRKEWIILTVVLVAFLLVGMGATTVRADAGGPLPTPTNVTLLNPLCTSGNTCNNNVGDLVHSIVNWLFIIATPIAVGMIIIGALQMLTAAGNEERFATGRKTILYAVIGYAIILIGWGITSIIQSLLG